MSAWSRGGTARHRSPLRPPRSWSRPPHPCSLARAAHCPRRVARPLCRSHATFSQPGRAWSPQAAPSSPPCPPACLCPTQASGGPPPRVYKGARWPAAAGFELNGCAVGALLGLPALQRLAALPACSLCWLWRGRGRRIVVGLPTQLRRNYCAPPAPRRAPWPRERHGSPPLASSASRAVAPVRPRLAGMVSPSGPEATAARPRLMVAGSGSHRKAKPPSGVLRSLAERASTCKGQSRADGELCEHMCVKK